MQQEHVQKIVQAMGNNPQLQEQMQQMFIELIKKDPEEAWRQQLSGMKMMQLSDRDIAAARTIFDHQVREIQSQTASSSKPTPTAEKKKKADAPKSTPATQPAAPSAPPTEKKVTPVVAAQQVESKPAGTTTNEVAPASAETPLDEVKPAVTPDTNETEETAPPAADTSAPTQPMQQRQQLAAPRFQLPLGIQISPANAASFALAMMLIGFGTRLLATAGNGVIDAMDTANSIGRGIFGDNIVGMAAASFLFFQVVNFVYNFVQPFVNPLMGQQGPAMFRPAAPNQQGDAANPTQANQPKQ